MNVPKNMAGQTVGRWNVISRDGGVGRAGKHARWLCICSCGTARSVSGAVLRHGASLSCGCLQSEGVTDRNLKHGLYGTRTYEAWHGMKERVKPNAAVARYYFDRGIAVCDRWQVFENFLEDMGVCPPGLTLDRINNDDGYRPGNCRWSTWSQQNLNRRKPRRKV